MGSDQQPVDRFFRMRVSTLLTALWARERTKKNEEFSISSTISNYHFTINHVQLRECPATTVLGRMNSRYDYFIENTDALAFAENKII